MRRKYIKKQFIDSPNKILCDYCEKEISENKIRCRGLGVKICTNCIKKREEWINQQRIKKPNQSKKSFFIYDFFLPNHNTLIEFDGRQHFIAIEHWGGEKALQRNKIKQ